MSHKGHPLCPYTSRAKCEKARREAIGPCIAMLDENRQCSHLGTDTVDGRAYCGVHVNGPYLAATDRERRRALKAAMNARIDAYLAHTGQEAHECGDQCQYSSLAPVPKLLDPQPRPEDLFEYGAASIDMVTGVAVRWTDRGYEEVL